MTLLDHLSRSPATRGLKTDHLSDLENGYAIATPSPASGPAKTVALSPFHAGRVSESSSSKSIIVAERAPGDLQITRADTEKALDASKRRMVANGRCIHQAQYLSARFSLETFAHLSNINSGAGRHKDHTECATQDWCNVYHVDEKTYKTRHVEEHCTCDMVSINYQDLKAIISSGSIPLVSIEFDSDDEPVLRLSKAAPEVEYTTISHVWIDGLGNFAQNAVPKCQILEMACTLHDLTGDAQRKFWFDTLCIPVEEKDEKLKFWSMDAMAAIYHGAQQTLILDAELIGTIAVDSMCFVDKIVCSTWMCRCWTLQEGALSKKCAFKFGNGVIYEVEGVVARGKARFRSNAEQKFAGKVVSTSNHNHAGKCRRRNHTIGLPSSLPTQTAESSQLEADISQEVQGELEEYLHHEFFGVRVPQEDTYIGLVRTWNALAGRSTTKPNDVYFMMANILGISCSKLVRLLAQDRLEAILFSTYDIPFSLFFNTGPRCEAVNQNRWIPTQLSRDFMVSDPSLWISKTMLVLEPEAINQHAPQVKFYLSSQVLDPLAKNFTISIKDCNTRFIVQALHNPRFPVDNKNCMQTCFAIETEIIGSQQQHRAAIFYVRKAYVKKLWEHWRRKHEMTLQLLYHCSARARRVDVKVGVDVDLHSSMINNHPELEVTLVPGNRFYDIEYDRENVHKCIGKAIGVERYHRVDERNGRLVLLWAILILSILPAAIIGATSIRGHLKSNKDIVTLALFLGFLILVPFGLWLIYLLLHYMPPDESWRPEKSFRHDWKSTASAM